MDNRMEKIAIVAEMVKLGYHLFNETPAEFVDRTGYDVETYRRFMDRFKGFRGID